MTAEEIRAVADNIRKKDIDFGPQAMTTLASLEIAAQLAELNANIRQIFAMDITPNHPRLTVDKLE